MCSGDEAQRAAEPVRTKPRRYADALLPAVRVVQITYYVVRIWLLGL